MLVTILIKILSKTSARKKNTNLCKKKKNSPWNEIFYPWKNTKIVPVKKKSVREKNRKKCAWKTLLAREKIPKNQKQPLINFACQWLVAALTLLHRMTPFLNDQFIATIIIRYDLFCC